MISKFKTYIIILVSIIFITNISAQNLKTKSGVIKIYSETPAFTIDGDNKKCIATLNTQTGEVEVSLLVRSFEFDDAVVKEQFNVNYIESHIYPKSTFSGKITNNADIDYTKNGEYTFTIQGELTIHGVTRPITEQGVIKVENGNVTVDFNFDILLTDYDVKIQKAYKHAIKNDVSLICELVFKEK
jgi:hypothetical protein